MSKRFPLAMFPIFNFQIQIQIVSFGQSVWKRISNRLDTVFTDKTVKEIFAAMPNCNMIVIPWE